MQKAFKIIFVVCVVVLVLGLLLLRYVTSQFMSGEMVEYITPTPLATTTPPATSGTPPSSPSAQLFFVALEDNGVKGTAIGCGDSIVGIDDPMTPSMQGIIEKLLSIKEREYGPERLYNALSQSSLRVDSLTQTGTVVDVQLTGKYQIGGVCDGPRIQAQLEETLKQFENVTEVNIFINEIPLEELLSGQ